MKNKEEADINSINTMKAYHSIGIGSFIGAVEVLVNHPLWSIKTRRQYGDTFTINPKTLYRGLSLNLISTVPTVAFQVTFGHFIQHRILCSDDNSARILSALGGGCASTVIMCPIELVMTQQQKHKSSPQKAFSDLFKKNSYKSFYTAATAIAVRESLFTMGYFSLFPIMKKNVETYYPSEFISITLSGLVTGVFSAFVSHPPDTVKTVQQAAVDKGAPGTYQTIKKIYSENGMHGFFKGFIPRATRATAAITIMGTLTSKLEKYFKEENSLKFEI